MRVVVAVVGVGGGEVGMNREDYWFLRMIFICRSGLRIYASARVE